MKNLKLIRNYPEGTKVEVKGWIKQFQSHKNITFLQINDGSELQNFQIICKEELKGVGIGSAVEIEGTIKITKNQPEIEAQKIKITESENFPIQKKSHSFEFLREKSYLRHRTNTFQAVNNIKSEAWMAIHSFFYENGFKWIQSPILTKNSCEGGSSAFEIQESENFFKSKALLSVSGQLHAEALAQGLGKVYCFGPTFRAEKSNSKNHLAEFWMIEPEVAFCDLKGIIEIMEKFLKYIVSWILKNNSAELNFLQEKLPENQDLIEKLNNLVNSDFKKLDYKEAIDLLQKDGYKVEWGEDLNSEMEKHITKKLNGPVFVHSYPKKIKSFYMKKDESNELVVKSVDMLIPGIGELMGGSERENKYEIIYKNSTPDLDWYTEIRKYGYNSSSGFGCGYERLIMYLTGIQNIKDIVNFPRSWGYISC